MGLFRKRPATPPPTVAQSLDNLVKSSGQPSLFAHSEFVKQVTCSACGAPKRLPSKTAYLYCDHCGALVDYDFRLANSDPRKPRWPPSRGFGHEDGPAGGARRAGPS